MCILAHPDDESLGTGGILARYAAQGVETYLLTATRGERGWFGPAGEYPGLAELGKLREAELREAARVLGIREVTVLDYVDGDLDRADPAEVISQIASHLRRVRPQVVVTFGPEGSYGHPDHIAISQFATAATILAANSAFKSGQEPCQVSKLYYIVESQRQEEAVRQVLGELCVTVDGVKRCLSTWPSWAVTSRIDVSAQVGTVIKAALCHRSQWPTFRDALLAAPEDVVQTLMGEQTLYRAFSLVNGGRQQESDLFAGIPGS